MRYYLILFIFILVFTNCFLNLIFAKNTISDNLSQETVALAADSFNIKDIDNFLFQLKNAIVQNNVNIIANFFKFPLNCNVCKSPYKILSKQIFKKRYKEILTPKVISVILNSSSSNISINSQGCMIGHGVIWFHPHKGVLSIN